jgi:carbohydrate-binding DOMON domain-containing protein
VQAAGKAISEGCKTYFYAQFVAYILGLVTTVVFMTVYKTAQVPYRQHKDADHSCDTQAPPYTPARPPARTRTRTQTLTQTQTQTRTHTQMPTAVCTVIL